MSRLVEKALVLSVLVASAVALPGCEENKEAIDRILVRLGTGPEGSDGDVDFCFTVDGVEECHELTSGGNDFESNQQRTYEVRPGGSLTKSERLSNLQLEYRALVGDEWAVASLNVTVVTNGGEQIVLCDTKQTATLDPGNAFNPGDCP